MKDYGTLVDYFRDIKEIDDRGITFVHIDSEEFMSYKQLYFEANNVLKYLNKKDVNNGSELCICIDDTRFQVIYYWACILGGIIPVIYPVNKKNINKSFIQIKNLIEKFNDPYIVVENEQVMSMISQDIQFYNYIMTNKIINKEEYKKLSSDIKTIENQISIHQDDIAMIQYSSGSTGSPKGVMLTHDNIITNVKDMVNRLKLTDSEKQLSWLPLTHNLGLIGFHILPLCNKYQHCIIDTECFIRNPLIWMEKASELKSTIIVSPNYGFRLVLSLYDQKKSYNWDLSNLNYIICGGEPVSCEILNKFIEVMHQFGMKKNILYPAYGMAEASLAISLPAPDDEFESLIINKNSAINNRININYENDNEKLVLSLLGKPLDNLKVRVCNLENQIVEDDTIGVVQINGRNVTKGYYKNEEENKKSFTSDGWFITKDIGFIHNEKMVINGRLSDMIIINGVNYYPQDIEQLIRDEDEFVKEEVVVCGIDNEKEYTQSLVVFCSKVTPDKADKFRKIIREKTGIIIQDIIEIKEIPKTESGKLQRSILKKMYENGEFYKHETENKLGNNINEESIKEALINGSRTILALDEIDEEKSFFDMGLDSNAIMKLYNYVTDNITNKITIMDLFNNGNIKQLCKCIMDYEITKEEVDITFLKIPSNYIKPKSKFKEIKSFKISINKEEIHHIFNTIGIVSEKLLYDFLEKIFIIECCKITNQQNIVVQSKIENDCIYQVIADISNFDTVLEFVANGNLQRTKYDMEKLELKAKFMNYENEFLPLFYINRVNNNFINCSDFRINAELLGDELLIFFEFDENRYISSFVNTFINEFIYLVRNFAIL